VIALGVALVVLPTIFALYPNLAQLAGADRLTILLVWLLAALVAGTVATLADARLHDKIDAQSETSDEQLVKSQETLDKVEEQLKSTEKQLRIVELAERRAVLRERLDAMLPGPSGPPDNDKLTLYAPTPDERFLVPIFPRVVSLTDPAIFSPGAGAVGKAWDGPEDLFVATGDDVSNDEHGLTRHNKWLSPCTGWSRLSPSGMVSHPWEYSRRSRFVMTDTSRKAPCLMDLYREVSR
jgi:hypothetical protein